MNIQKISLKTSDGLTLSANFYKADSDIGVILLHQLGRDNLFANRLNKKSYDNQNAWTCYRIGECLNYLNKPNEALFAFQQANKLAPHVPEFIDKLATAYAIVGNNKMAHQYFEQALKENPKYAPLCLQEGQELTILGVVTSSVHQIR